MAGIRHRVADHLPHPGQPLRLGTRQVEDLRPARLVVRAIAGNVIDLFEHASDACQVNQQRTCWVTVYLNHWTEVLIGGVADLVRVDVGEAVGH
jgi:hypothetical protein